MTLELDLKVCSNFICRVEGKLRTGIKKIKIEDVVWGQVVMHLECQRKGSKLQGPTRSGLNYK